MNLCYETIKRKSAKNMDNILFVKWDRFSRNIEYAYEMIGLLRKYNVTAMAIDQPIDFEIPESTVMLAVYLAVPEAENTRRSLNTSNGMRRAKLLGRHPNRAPLGYINITAADGRKQIVPNNTDATLVKWSFEQLSKNAYSMEEVRRMVNVKGLRCSRSHFWKILRNPVYCGFVSFLEKDSGERQLIRGIHEPIVSEELFSEVQSIINSKRRFVHKKQVNKESLILHKYLACPSCDRTLRGSYSQG
ncbi:MAG: recombinase family protein, partial [Mucilaginibacter sp.]|nr:recombinase family protein [Mucilaginibacter sp.]